MHTQGPWEWKDDMGLVVGPADDPAGNPVAEIIGHPGEAFGNAQLIALAPELLDVVVNLDNYLTRGKDRILDGYLGTIESLLHRLGSGKNFWIKGDKT